MKHLILPITPKTRFNFLKGLTAQRMHLIIFFKADTKQYFFDNLEKYLVSLKKENYTFTVTRYKVEEYDIAGTPAEVIKAAILIHKDIIIRNYKTSSIITIRK